MIVFLNGAPELVEPGSTLADVVATLALPDRGIALALDGEVVHRQAWAMTALTERARVEVVTAMQGG